MPLPLAAADAVLGDAAAAAARAAAAAARAAAARAGVAVVAAAVEDCPSPALYVGVAARARVNPPVDPHPMQQAPQPDHPEGRPPTSPPKASGTPSAALQHHRRDVEDVAVG